MNLFDFAVAVAAIEFGGTSALNKDRCFRCHQAGGAGVAGYKDTRVHGLDIEGVQKVDLRNDLKVISGVHITYQLQC